MSDKNESDQIRQFQDHLAKANQAIDMAVKELVKTRGQKIGRRDTYERFLSSLLRGISAKQIKKELEEYLKKDERDQRFVFKETDKRDMRIGKIRPVDLVYAYPCTTETMERYIVIDLKGTVKKVGEEGFQLNHVRFEAWCRLYYIPDSDRWYVHYVDMIVRHKNPPERVLFRLEYEGDSDVPTGAVEKDPDELCLFFESLQGGMWG